MVPPTPRRDVLRLGALAAASVTLAACSRSVAPQAPTAPRKQWGAFIPYVIPSAAPDRTPIQRLEALAGARPDYLHRFAAFGDSPPIAELDVISYVDAVPLLTLEPWTPGAGAVQPMFALSRIASGVFDGDLRKWASALQSWGKPLLLRFAQEMNGTWYPWSIGVNGNTAADYRAAWIRVRTVFADAGAQNVKFVWAPNVITAGTTDFADAFPGADHVDHLGLDGYNWGDVEGHRWQPADELFRASIARLRSLDAQHSILITEVASADGPDPQMKAQWIRDFVRIVESEEGVDAFLWFQMDKERDWRFNSTPQSTNAFRESLAGMLGQRVR